MRRLNPLALVLVLAFGLASCAKLTAAYNVLSGLQVTPTTVYVAANAFDVLEQTATNYLRLPKCPLATPVCSDPLAVAQIVPLIRSGRVARTNLEAFMRANPGQFGPVSLYNALTSVTSALQQIMTEYNIKGA